MRMILLGALALLAGCSNAMNEPFITLAKTPTTFAAELYGALLINGPMGGQPERYQAAVEAADAHCAGFGKTARLTGETDGSRIDRRRLTFACL